MGEVVHRDDELMALGGTAGFGSPGLLETGIEHQGVDRRAALEQLRGAALDAGQVGEIADGSVDGGGSPGPRRGHRSAAGLRGERLGRDFARAGRQKPLHGGHRGGLVPAGKSEGMARMEQQPGRLETDAGTGAGEQDAPEWLESHWVGSRRLGGHGGTLCTANGTAA